MPGWISVLIFRVLSLLLCLFVGRPGKQRCQLHHHRSRQDYSDQLLSMFSTTEIIAEGQLHRSWEWQRASSSSSSFSTSRQAWLKGMHICEIETWEKKLSPPQNTCSWSIPLQGVPKIKWRVGWSTQLIQFCISKLSSLNFNNLKLPSSNSLNFDNPMVALPNFITPKLDLPNSPNSGSILQCLLTQLVGYNSTIFHDFLTAI